jgi:hypothetical protein
MQRSQSRGPFDTASLSGVATRPLYLFSQPSGHLPALSWRGAFAWGGHGCASSAPSSHATAAGPSVCARQCSLPRAASQSSPVAPCLRAHV